MKFHFTKSKPREKHFSTKKLIGKYQIAKTMPAFRRPCLQHQFSVAKTKYECPYFCNLDSCEFRLPSPKFGSPTLVFSHGSFVTTEYTEVRLDDCLEKLEQESTENAYGVVTGSVADEFSRCDCRLCKPQFFSGL